MPGKHQHFQEPEVGCCGKYFLFGFNIVFWVSVGWVPGPVLGATGRRRFSPLLGKEHSLQQELGTDGLPAPPSHLYLHAHLEDHRGELRGSPDCRGGGGSQPLQG